MPLPPHIWWVGGTQPQIQSGWLRCWDAFHSGLKCWDAAGNLEISPLVLGPGERRKSSSRRRTRTTWTTWRRRSTNNLPQADNGLGPSKHTAKDHTLIGVVSNRSWGILQLFGLKSIVFKSNLYQLKELKSCRLPYSRVYQSLTA